MILIPGLQSADHHGARNAQPIMQFKDASTTPIGGYRKQEFLNWLQHRHEWERRYRCHFKKSPALGANR